MGGPRGPARARRLVNTAGPSLGLPHADVIVTTLNALGLLVAACIGASQYKAAGGK